ncbi:MAG: UbiA family prenyltransferase [Anaerolineae bacterium]|nr:UbiA family prenyltransferase [Anaerolineae bacterium]
MTGAQVTVETLPTSSPSRLNRMQYFLRWRDWGFSKVPLICTVFFYLALTYHHRSLVFVISCLAFLLFAASHSALAYVMNDWGDRFADRRRGKWNVFLGLSQRKSLISLGVLVFIAGLSAVPFVMQPWFLLLWLIWLAVVAAYLLPPLHLKEYGRWWRVLEVIAQWVLPVGLAFAAFGHFGGWDMFLYALVLAVVGLSLDQSQVKPTHSDQLLEIRKQGSGHS